jgi:hypothetical protein
MHNWKSRLLEDMDEDGVAPDEQTIEAILI